MATHKVKKIAVETTDIGGLKSSRYEKLQVSYGKILAAAYSPGDTLVFADVPSQRIVKATVVAHSNTSPAVLDVYPGSAKNSPFTLNLPTGQSSSVDLSYIIEYVRGGGKVGSSTGDDSGEGELFKVIIATSSKTAAEVETQVAPE